MAGVSEMAEMAEMPEIARMTEIAEMAETVGMAEMAGICPTPCIYKYIHINRCEYNRCYIYISIYIYVYMGGPSAGCPHKDVPCEICGAVSDDCNGEDD